MAFFNTAGPVNPNDHYCVDFLDRPETKDILKLIDQKKYFLIHAPKQSGKTSLLLALSRHLNKEGKVKALYINVEPSALYQEDTTECFKSIFAELASRARDYLNDPYPEEIAFNILETKGPGFALNELLTLWAKRSNKPIVLLFDEVDTLKGDALISFLKQLRSGFDKRPDFFPQSIVLCGVQDIRHKVIKIVDDNPLTGGDVFNIEARSIRLGNLSRDDIYKLMESFKKDMNIKISSDTAKRIYEKTKGQPWLVNAIAFEIGEEMVPRKSLTKITPKDIDEAVENITQRQEIHLNSLTDRLKEDRVRRIITPILIGSEFSKEVAENDLRYLKELGILSEGDDIEISNPIYKEIIPRSLIQSTKLLIRYELNSFIDEEGSLDLEKAMSSFQKFYSNHAKVWNSRFLYKEAGRHLFLQAFLQRIADGGGRLERHYGLGRNQVSLSLSWPFESAWKKYLVSSRYVFAKRSLQEGLYFILKEMDEQDIVEGFLILFYPLHMEITNQKQFYQLKKVDEKRVHVWGLTGY